MGPVILDVEKFSLTPEEREMLAHPLVGGVILFSRNYESKEQITALCESIRAARSTPLLIGVDQEGGRVQRFKEEFTHLPAMGLLGNAYEKNSNDAKKIAETCGWLMASELFSVGIDLSFAPVLDLNKNKNTVIGDRAFHHDSEIVIDLAKFFIKGMHAVGMAATGKHFPGHGDVSVDSHLTIPRDERSLKEIQENDLKTFSALIQSDIQAIMPAHIIFSAVDSKPVGFSSIWLQKIVRQELKFSGMIFSDDLNMEGASFAGDYPDRADAALKAGCDMVLICNNRTGAIRILDQLPRDKFSVSQEKFNRMQGKFSSRGKSVLHQPAWQARFAELQHFLNGINHE